MNEFINSPFYIGRVKCFNRLIQGPLAGYSCAPFRELFHYFKSPAYCVSEMISAHDLIHKHTPNSRYMYRSPKEQLLAYQLSGTDDLIMSQAAQILQDHGADLIDINCGCPKTKIRKKGAGSALLEKPEQLIQIIRTVRRVLTIPLTVKIRIQGNNEDFLLAQKIQEAGADALIVHGRRWFDDYDIPSDLKQIARIKEHCTIPIIVNGDIYSTASLTKAIEVSRCDGFMISRAGTGKPWLYQELLENITSEINEQDKVELFLEHVRNLASLENEYKAIEQSKSLVRYYFRTMHKETLKKFYSLSSLSELEGLLREGSFTQKYQDFPNLKSLY